MIFLADGEVCDERTAASEMESNLQCGPVCDAERFFSPKICFSSISLLRKALLVHLHPSLALKLRL